MIREDYQGRLWQWLDNVLDSRQYYKCIFFAIYSKEAVGVRSFGLKLDCSLNRVNIACK